MPWWWLVGGQAAAVVNPVVEDPGPDGAAVVVAAEQKADGRMPVGDLVVAEHGVVGVHGRACLPLRVAAVEHQVADLDAVGAARDPDPPDQYRRATPAAPEGDPRAAELDAVPAGDVDPGPEAAGLARAQRLDERLRALSRAAGSVAVADPRLGHGRGPRAEDHQQEEGREQPGCSVSKH